MLHNDSPTCPETAALLTCHTGLGYSEDRFSLVIIRIGIVQLVTWKANAKVAELVASDIKNQVICIVVRSTRLNRCVIEAQIKQGKHYFFAWRQLSRSSCVYQPYLNYPAVGLEDEQL